MRGKGQLTLGFTARQPYTPAPSRSLNPVPFDASVTRWPGTASTVLVRIETDITRTSEVFAAGLADLLDRDEDIERWWFTRYRDPGPHLRVRITLKQSQRFGDVAAHVATWAAHAHRGRLLTAISWPTDLPETGAGTEPGVS
jgi:hypothetical protein